MESRDEEFFNSVGRPRISSRQIDELVGIARGVAADGLLNQREVEFLQRWLAANIYISDQPVIRTLYQRINDILRDSILDPEEATLLLETLNAFSSRDFELGEVLKATTLPVCVPAPNLQFERSRYCFTGTFNFGQRKHCESAVIKKGAIAGPLIQTTNVLVIGTYATDSWKHSSFGTKILRAVEWRDSGVPISIVTEEHWTHYL